MLATNEPLWRFQRRHHASRTMVFETIARFKARTTRARVVCTCRSTPSVEEICHAAMVWMFDTARCSWRNLLHTEKFNATFWVECVTIYPEFCSLCFHPLGERHLSTVAPPGQSNSHDMSPCWAKFSNALLGYPTKL